jgi:hypothetical protein
MLPCWLVLHWSHFFFHHKLWLCPHSCLLLRLPTCYCCRCFDCTPQERQLLAEGVNSWQQNYFMPGTSDTGEGTRAKGVVGKGSLTTALLNLGKGLFVSTLAGSHYLGSDSVPAAALPAASLLVSC